MLWPSPRRYRVRVWVKPADPPTANSRRKNEGYSRFSPKVQANNG